MSVRPITYTEEQKAKGYPFANIFGVLGGLQGLVIYLHHQRIPIRDNWFARPGSLGRFSVLVIGGYFVGAFFGSLSFGDRDLLRLFYAHK